MEPEGLPLGFRFRPKHHELLLKYLLNKVFGHPLPWDVIMDIDVYDNFNTLQRIFKEKNEDSLYFFTRLKKTAQKGSRIERTVKGYGTWKESQKRKYVSHEGRVIGSQRGFKLNPSEGVEVKGRWLMDEFELDQRLLRHVKYKDYVICHVHIKASQNSTPTKGFEEQDDGRDDVVMEEVPDYVEPEHDSGVIMAPYYEAQQRNSTAMNPSGADNQQYCTAAAAQVHPQPEAHRTTAVAPFGAEYDDAGLEDLENPNMCFTRTDEVVQMFADDKGGLKDCNK